MPNLIRYIVQEDPEDKINETEQPMRMSAVPPQKEPVSLSAQASADPDSEIRERMYPIIKRFENEVKHPYKDSKGKITVGIGTNIHDLSKFGSINWTDEQGKRIPASQAMRYHRDLLKIEGNNYKADYYEKKTPLRIPEKDIRRLYDSHINDDLKDLRSTFKNFNHFPPELQNVLLDIKYNTGNVWQEKWPKLHQAIAERNIENILNNIHRKDVSIERNQWAEDEIRKIKRLDY